MSAGNRSQQSRERSAEERERAREERERRRGRTVGAEPPTVHEPVVGEPPTTEPPTVEEPVVPPVEPEPVASAREPVATGQEPSPVAQEPSDEQPIEARLLLAQPSSKRVPPSRPAGRRGRLTRARVGALLALAAALFVVWFLLSVFQPGAGAGHGRAIVEIPKGSSASAIGSILARDGVVSSGFFFDVRALLEGKRGDLHSGRFQMQRDMSYAAAIAALSQPPPAAIPVKVTIPEGETRRQIAALAAADYVVGSYLEASRRSRLLDPTRYGAPRGAPNLEGFLFPATYELNAGAPASRLVSEQLVAFQRSFGTAEIDRAHALGVTPYELLIVASMVEREALLARDRPRVAAVIYNRLRQGMPLGIDATIRYALNDYTRPLTEAQLQTDSPYNTRTRHGLPPTPISNPGMASMQAAAHPAHVPYLYYVNGPDGCGDLVFSTGYAQFERNAAAYREALAHNGGRVPTCKKR